MRGERGMREGKLGWGNGGVEIGVAAYALPAVAVRKTSSMWKSSRRSWSMMMDGEATPAAERAAPKMRPAVAVVRGLAAILLCLW